MNIYTTNDPMMYTTQQYYCYYTFSSSALIIAGTGTQSPLLYPLPSLPFANIFKRSSSSYSVITEQV